MGKTLNMPTMGKTLNTPTMGKTLDTPPARKGKGEERGGERGRKCI
jgi:hypothetical protein